LIVGLVLLAAAVAAVLLGTDVVGGNSARSETTVAREVSEPAPAANTETEETPAAPAATEARPDPTTTATTPASPASTATTRTTPTTTETDATVAYVRQVDALLRESHAVLLGLRSFVPRATSGAVSRSAAVVTARSYLAQRQRELTEAQALTAPPAFAPAQGLLVRSLRASVADDEALLAWTIARRDGSGDAQAALEQVNRIGMQATALKRQFLRVYGAKRRAATGRPAASLPDSF
jgi:hypothetical protein